MNLYPPDWLAVPSHLGSLHALTLFEIMFGCLYVEITTCMSGCKINHFDVINLHPLIRSKLSYLASQGGASLHMYAQLSNQTVSVSNKKWEASPNKQTNRCAHS